MLEGWGGVQWTAYIFPLVQILKQLTFCSNNNSVIVKKSKKSKFNITFVEAFICYVISWRNAHFRRITYAIIFYACNINTNV